MKNRFEGVAITKEDGLTSVVCVNTIQKNFSAHHVCFGDRIRNTCEIQIKWCSEGWPQPTQAHSMSAK